MPTGKATVNRPRRPLRKWIASVLGQEGPLTTTQLRKRVAQLSGAKYHINSMYLALKALKKDRVVSAARKGHERVYRLARTLGQAAGSVEKRVVARVLRRRSPAGSKPVPTAHASVEAPTVQTYPHRLAMGEIAIVRVEGGTVLSATNVHGELVLKRHRVPPGS